MKRLLVLLALLVAVPAQAQNTRLAVILASQAGLSTSGIESYPATHLRILDQLGIDYDVYHASIRTWGETGVADSTWFRQRYGAIYIPYFAKNASRGANHWASRFLNASAASGWDKSPITGKWSIPVYAANSFGGFAVETESPGSTDSLRLGIIAAGSRTAPIAPESLGTWRDRSLSWHRGRAAPDTVWGRSGVFTVRSASGMCGQFVAAISYLDTLANAAGAFPDTAMTTWRYRPLGPGTPGVVLTTLPSSYTTTSGTCSAALMLCQLMLQESTVKAARKIPLAYTVHHAQSGRTPDANVNAMVAGMLDAHERAGIFSFWAMKVAPAEWSAGGGGGAGIDRTSWDRIRAHLLSGFAVWYPHSHETAWDYNETDSVGMRVAFNAMLNTASNPDSFNLPRTRYDPRRIVPANDVMTKAAAATALRAGMTTLEVVLASMAGAADRFSHPALTTVNTFMVPGPSTIGFTKQSFDLGLQGDFATYKSTPAFSARIVSVTTNAIERALLAGNGIFQHYDALWGNTAGTPYTDRFNEWIIENVVGSYPKTYDKVIEWERPGEAAAQAGPLRTAR